MTSEDDKSGAAGDGGPEPQAPQKTPEPEKFADRCYRSPAGMAGGIVLLALGLWLCGDAVFTGTGATRWIALAGLVCFAPLVIAFTLRPAVYAGERRIRVRNPFRTVVAPWGTVESLRAAYSCELVADGTKYQLWAVPVSLRARKKATRHNERVASGRPAAGGPGGLFGGRGLSAGLPADVDSSERRAPSDRTVDELRELAEQHGKDEAAQGTVDVRWAYEVIAPAVVGAVALVVLTATS